MGITKDLLGTLIPIGGSLVGSGLEALFTSFQNKYNSPMAQLQRLREAGLPLAALGVQNTGQQTSVPEFGDIGTGNFMQNKLAKEQLELVRAQAAAAWQKAYQEEEITSWMKSQSVNTNTPLFFNQDPEQPSNQFKLMDLTFQKLEQEKTFKSIMSDIEQIKLNVQKILEGDHTQVQTAKAALDRLLKGNDLLRQNFNYTALFNSPAETIINAMKRGGMSVTEAILYNLGTGELGLPKFPSMSFKNFYGTSKNK